MPFDGIDLGGCAWRPQDGPQNALLSCPADEVLFGGARGGGKTGGALGAWLDHAYEYGPAAQGIFIRRRFKDLEGVRLQMEKFFRPLGVKYMVSSRTWVFPNGAMLRERHLWDERDAEAYQGHEYTFIVFEEAGQWPNPKAIDMLRATLRSTTGVRPRMILTANPGGSGHQWLKQRFVTPNRRGFTVFMAPDGSGTRCYIPSKVQDNAILMAADPNYVRRLHGLGNPSLVKAWLEGDWDIVAGGYFDDLWNADKQAVKPFPIPPHWKHRRGMDWGSAHPAAMAVAAEADGQAIPGVPGLFVPKGSLIIHRELYTAAKGPDGMSIPNEGLRQTNTKLGEWIAKTSRGLQFRDSRMDPSTTAKNGDRTIRAQMEEGARAFGDPWGFRDAHNQRVAGWQSMRQMMRHSLEARPEGPGLWVFDTCQEWLRTVPTLQRDKDNPEDVDTDNEDHMGDATRYMIHIPNRRQSAGGGLKSVQ